MKLSPFATPAEALRHQSRQRGDAEALAFPAFTLSVMALSYFRHA